ncbi:murein hydrolase activator EnvC family protein [Legionella fairfieldensis]|uniref:murein hydrolase activator EnvC family protein n=1 Tax=Legionella fairfieldensis TaxID=45064 RepID=UPI00048FD171|nr:peptidoglycan DD-metalloendopeptidase family protein [Legionella fairfieldensis]
MTLQSVHSFSSGLYISLVLLFFSSISWADNPSLIQTQSQLKQLDGQITQLKKILLNANDKRGLLNQELAETEKQIGKGIHHLQLIQQIMDEKKKKIQNVQKHINELNRKLIAQQQLLAEHVRIRYKTGEYQPLKWLLNQDNPYTISRLLTFHQYLIRSRQQIIDKIDHTKRNLTIDQETLKKELNEQQQLQRQLNKHQQALEQNKRYHKALIQSLNNEIQTKEHTLSDYERNKKKLAQLLKTLAAQSIIHTNQSFTQMQRKLPHPVNTKKDNLQKMNQGVTFFAAEGTPVTAIYSGKVVFSDWLNGYGLLLILDHGQGFMTLYAHNQSLFKPKGATVLQGEQIAAVGHSGGLKQNGLYFEVRHRGKAIPPLNWLS